MQIVKIINTGSTPVSFNGNERVILPPGDSRLVPWEFAASWLGDPNVDPRDRVYAYGLTRLSWGYAAGLDTAESWEDKRPKVEVYDTDTPDADGNPTRVFMLLDDPDGTRLGEFSPAGDVNLDADVNLLRKMVADQAAQMARMEALIASRLGEVEIEPATATALSTADSEATVAVGVELPKPVPTAADATDAPRAPRVRRTN